MADISIEQGKKRADLTWVWALAAIASIIALMAWLFTTQPTETAVVTGAGEDTAAVAGAPAETVELSAIGASPDQYAGREVTVNNVQVAAVLGPRTFWAEVPGASLVLVVIGPAVEDVAWIQPGNAATVQGTVQPATPQELDRLVQSQAMLADGRSQAEFATHYLSVTQVTR